MARIYPDCNSRVAHMRGVKAAVTAKGREIEATAKALLASHRQTGAARIERTREDTDNVISLVDPAALSIEFGRAGYTTDSGRHVGPMEGLHILRRAAGI